MDAPFRFYDPSVVSNKTVNRVPHWEQPGATYFTTFRLADAVPAAALSTFVRQKREWLAAYPQCPWPSEVEREYHNRFSKRFERWLDRGYGCCILKDARNAAIVADALRHFEGERSLLHAWVVMPNHVHVMFTQLGDHTLAGLMHSWK